MAARLWEQAERSTSARREEAIRLLDEAADKARVKLDALLAVSLVFCATRGLFNMVVNNTEWMGEEATLTTRKKKQ